ncbi:MULTISPECIES: hypothetical protein [Nostocaceae]|uniref:hypothetical protein n=1 Tax=Nostocaceae TaxID=1162 RepID=UPI001F5523A2|nr:MULTISPECIES: hypothetical protein [Nostocaceae]
MSQWTQLADTYTLDQEIVAVCILGHKISRLVERFLRTEEFTNTYCAPPVH